MLILDDLANEKGLYHSKTTRQLYGRGSYSFISIICVGQLNAMNIDLLCDEFRAPIINKKDFIELYKQCTLNYSFMIINNNTVNDVDNINTYYGKIKAQI